MFGARGITNVIEDTIMIQLAYAVLNAEHEGQTQVAFDVRLVDGKIVILEK
jgi:ATP-dependent Clp protease ATP-binding subunit ClpA